MIDETNLAIGQREDEIKRENEHRYAFYRMLHTTDRVLWRLEEMNRDGIKTIPGEMREAIREQIADLPTTCINVFRDTEAVQEVLDSVFEMQECLFRWRDPARAGEDEEELARLAV